MNTHHFIWDNNEYDYVCIFCKAKLIDIINKDLNGEVCPKKPIFKAETSAMLMVETDQKQAFFFNEICLKNITFYEISKIK